MRSMIPCLSLFGILLKKKKHKTTNWVVFKQQKFICHSSGGWKAQDDDASRFSVCWGLAFWFIDDRPLTVSSHGARGEEDLFHDGTKPVHEGSTLRSQASPKGPHLLIPSHQALRFQYMSLGEGHSDCSTPISLCFPQCSLLCFPLHPDNLNPSRKPLANTCSLSVRWLELRRFCSKATKTG